MQKRVRNVILVALFVLSFVIISAGEESFARARTGMHPGGETSFPKATTAETAVTEPAQAYGEILIQALGTGQADTDLLESWIALFPGSALRHLPSWKAERQKRTGLLAAYILRENRHLDTKTAWREASAFVHYGSKYGVPLDLLVAVANTESHFKPTARSSYGASGIMQVVWRIHANLMQANGILSEEELFDPEKGIAAGTLLLSRYLRAYGTTQKALGRYYGGSPSVYMSRINKKLDRLRRFSAKASQATPGI